MPSIASAFGASAASDLWRDERINDDRLHVDAVGGLALVVDAAGPMYGGYHAPFAIDPGIATLADTFRRAEGSTRDRLVTAVETAHATMRAMNDRYEARRAGRLGLAAAREAADAVRPPAWEGFDSHAHFMGSVTACGVGPDTVVIAQVGECRAYGLREGAPVLLAPDHTLPSVLEASGAPREEVEQARQEHWSVVVALLGSERLQINVVEVPVPTTIALVTNGVWRCGDEIEAVFRARSREDLSRLVLRCAQKAKDDATAVFLEVR